MNEIFENLDNFADFKITSDNEIEEDSNDFEETGDYEEEDF